MRKLTLLTFLCMLMVVPLAIGQTSLTSELGANENPINFGPAGTATAANNGGMQFLPPVVITNNFGQTNNGTDLACASSVSIRENSIYSEYDLVGNFGITGDFEVTAVEFGVGTNGGNTVGSTPVTINIWSNTGVFPAGSLTLQGTAGYSVTSADAGTIVSVAVSATIPFGENLVFEIFNADQDPNNNVFRYATNTDGALAESLIRAPICGLSSPLPMSAIGFGGNNFIMNVISDPVAPPPPPVGVCGNAPELIPASGTAGPMNPSVAVVADAGVIGAGPGEYYIDNVSLNLEHSWANDLDITLTSPGGTVLALSLGNGGNTGLDVTDDLVFTDASSNNITGWGGGPPLADYMPEGGAFAATFAGESITGNWTLNIFDNFFGDDGTLFSYCINFIPNPPGNPPVIVCPGDIIAETDPGVCGAVVNYADAIAIDPEDGVVPTVQISPDPAVLGSGDEFPVGDTVVTFEAVDSEGNSSTCSFTITVNDTEIPLITCPADITVDNDPGICGAVVTYFDPQVIDNCFSGGGGAAGTYDMTIDFTNPNLQSTNLFSFTGAEVGASGDATLEVRTFGDIDGTGGNEEMWTITDEDGGTTGTIGATGSFSDQCNTTLLEVFTIPAATIDAWAADGVIDFTGTDVAGNINTVLCGGDFLELRLYYDWNTQGPPAPYTVITGFPSGGVFPVGTTLTTLEYVDAGGNAVQCTFNVTVNDVEAPVISCIGEPGIFNITEDFESGLPAGWSTVINSGPCDWLNIQDLPIGPDFTSLGMVFDDDDCGLGQPPSNATLVSDVYDLSASTTATIGYDVAFIELGAGEYFLVEVWDGAAWQQVANYVADIDPILTESIDVTAFMNANFQVRWTYDDGGAWAWHGGIDNFTLDYDVPGGTSYDIVLDANGMATLDMANLIQGATDNCGNVIVTTVGAPPVTEILPTTFAGGNGQSGNMFDITAINELTINSFDVNMDTGTTDDVEIYYKTGTYAGFQQDPAAWTLLATVTGVTSAGEGLPTPLNQSLGLVVGAGETVAFYVTLTSTTNINYTNGTATGALFASDANLEFYEGDGNAYPFGSNFSPRVFNGNIVYSVGTAASTTMEIDCSMLGENLIEVMVTDASGNSSFCTATVNVIDDTSPVLVCWDVTVEVGADGTAAIDPTDLLATTGGVYDVMVIGSDNGSGSEGFTDFTVNVTDAATVEFDWDYTVSDVPGFDSFGYLLNGTYFMLTDPAIGNQSGNASVAVAPGDVFGFRSQTDDNVFGGNETVISNFLPGFEGQFAQANWNLTLTNSDGDAFFIEVIPPGPLSFDACGITVLAVDIIEVTCADIGAPITATVFASDASGNIAACNSQITVVDLMAPEITCPADQTIDPGPGNLFYEVPDYFATGEASATDNCTDPVVNTTQDPPAGTLLSDGVYTVTCTATDEYGNTSTCTFVLTIESVLGVNDNALDVAIAMYPNPAMDQVTISNSSSILLEKASIFDANGRLVMDVNLQDMQGEKVIDVSQLASGVYMVQIAGEQASVVKRLIKE